MKLLISSALLLFCVSANASDRCDKVEQIISKFQDVHSSGEDVLMVERFTVGSSGKKIAKLISSLVLAVDAKTETDRELLILSVKTGCVLGEAIKEQNND